MLTTLHGFDQERNDDVILVWDAVNFSCLGNFSTSINKCSRKKTLTAVSLAVGNKKRMFGELCAPSNHRRDKRGVEGFFMFTAYDGTMTGRREVEPGAELEGVKEGKAGMDDLEVNLDEVQGESRVALLIRKYLKWSPR